ncbi:MAG: UvrD-helicase domain-containing protein [Candidatus Eremiobacteraeota bacterium]|nr:UvrD-helicase domain-containing protein [Candidatus Eremiobacteraeota bacterium]MBC5827726.1 UvrD-helicase domain-containing protein [Candidatus Eremiobacteraeota bacterium]
MKQFQQLNDEQRVAADHAEGAVLIFAGAGSGKTRVLTHRIGELIAGKSVPAPQILAVTFTNKAAGELKSRLRTLAGDAAGGLWVGTFHSIGVRILRRDGALVDAAPNFVIYDDADQRTLMKDVLRDLNLDERRYPPGAVLAQISRAKERCLTPESFASSGDGQLAATVASLYFAYQRRLNQANALDFDDLIMRTIALVEHDDDVGRAWRKRFRYVLVDEYQDVNEAQYRMVRALSRGNGNICAVGDDDQSIYAFRGADHRIILRFERDFPGAATYRLERNYRSTPPILAAANSLVQHNTHRHHKKLWTSRESGAAVRVYAAATERDEARYTLAHIMHGVDQGRSLSDHVVLYRTNAQSRAFEEAMLARGIPYRIVGGVGFYARAEIKDALAYLRYIVNRDDGVSLRRIINAPRRGVGHSTLTAIATLASQRGLTFAQALTDEGAVLSAAPKKSKEIARFLRDIDRFAEVGQTVGPASLLVTVLEETGYLRELRGEEGTEAQSRLENLQELVGVARDYEEREGRDLMGFLATISLVSDLDALDAADSAVTLMTLHMAKGLEFPVVFLCGLEEGVFPHGRSLLDPADIEEERRLCYVGMTRAIEELHLSYAKRRSTFGSAYMHPPSRFLTEMEGLEYVNAPALPVVGSGSRWEEVALPVVRRDIADIDLRVGDSVVHQKFGAGKVLQVRGAGGDAFITVDFDGSGRKNIMLNYAKLEKA